MKAAERKNLFAVEIEPEILDKMPEWFKRLRTAYLEAME